MTDAVSAHLYAAGGGKSFFVAIAGEPRLIPKRQVKWTRRFDRSVRAHLIQAMTDAINLAKRRGAVRLTIDPELEHELNIQHMGFDPLSQELLSF